MLQIRTVSFTATSHNCFHFRESVLKPVVIELGEQQFHLCAKHAEEMLEYIKGQLEIEQEVPIIPMGLCATCRGPSWKHEKKGHVFQHKHEFSEGTICIICKENVNF